MPSEFVTKCSKVLAAKEWNIAFAESATAGRMSAEFSMTKESGKILRGGIACYEVFVKEQILNVPHAMIEKYTPESAEVTKKLAEQMTKLFNAKVTVAVTGLTTPSGSETPEKPVGTFFFSIITPSENINKRKVFKGDSEQIIIQAIDETAKLIIESIASL